MASYVRLIRAVADKIPLCVTLVDCEQDDQPLVYVNQVFERLIGYQSKEVIGRNCRFLQGELTDGETVDSLRRCIAAEQACFADLQNYRKDGSVFWNRLILLPLFREGESLFIGLQKDITAEKRNSHTSLKVPPSIFHDISNPLTAVISLQALIDFTPTTDDSSVEFVEELGTAIEQLRTHIDSLPC